MTVRAVTRKSMRKRTIEMARSALPDQPETRFLVFVDDVLVGELGGGEPLVYPDKPDGHIRLVPVHR